jgi:hypothetical protein
MQARNRQKMRKIGGPERFLHISIKIHAITNRDGHRHPSAAGWHMCHNVRAYLPTPFLNRQPLTFHWSCAP